MNQAEEYHTLCKSLVGGFGRVLELNQVGASHWEFQVPHGDQHGDPLWFSVALSDDKLTVNDGGAVAGLLFSLDQDDEGSVGLELLSSLAEHHGIDLDYNQGLLHRTCQLEKTKDILPSFTRVIVSLLTTIPHLESVTSTLPKTAHAVEGFIPRVEVIAPLAAPAQQPESPSRELVTSARRRYGGGKAIKRRLTSRVMDGCRKSQISRFVENRGYILGGNGAVWQTDFHWETTNSRNVEAVSVVAEDLNVKSPLPKAHKVSSLALDTKEVRARSARALRVVIDTGDQQSGETLEASRLIHSHKLELGYEVFDFANTSQYDSFFQQAREELLFESGSELPVRSL